jgi:hypothetical protein
MKAGRYGAALLLLAGLGWHGSAGATPPQNRQSVSDHPPMSSRCMAECNELAKVCEEHERLRPTCSVVDICFEEKAQCETLCRPRVMLNLRSAS